MSFVPGLGTADPMSVSVCADMVPTKPRAKSCKISLRMAVFTLLYNLIADGKDVVSFDDAEIYRSTALGSASGA